MSNYEDEAKTIREAKTSLDNKAVCVSKKKEIITKETGPVKPEFVFDPDSAWNRSTYVPLAQVKLLISESLRSLGHKLTSETKRMLESVLHS